MAAGLEVCCGGRPTVMIELTDAGRKARMVLELHVRDEGPGLPPDFLPHAFERFSRADSARTSGGAGLGLALASTIAEAHGGTAHAASSTADIWLSIPR